MNRGGAETMIMNLYRNIDREKIQFDFVECSSEVATFDQEIQTLGGRIFRCPRYTGKNHFAYVKWWNHFFSEHANEYKIVHGHIGSTASIYLSVAKKYGLFTIAHSHSAGGTLNIKGRVYRALSYNTRNIADYFFACSDMAGVDRFGSEVVSHSKRYCVLNNAIDTKLFQYDEKVRKCVRQELQFTEEQHIVGHIGRFSREKNHVFLIDIFAEILRLNPDTRLILVGGGDGMAAIQEKAAALGLVDKVIFTGVRDDVNRLLQAMDVFVFPSLYEGLPVTLVEAQTSGLPCVISDHVPRECIITDGLVTVQSLTDSAETWAKRILARIGMARTDHSEEIAAHGYDISEIAKWLEEFYVRKYEEHTRY